MAYADVTLLPIIVAMIAAFKLLKDDWKRRATDLPDLTQYKLMCLLLFVHFCGTVGTVFSPEYDATVPSNWYGRIWAFRYLLIFFLAWVLEIFWMINNMRQPGWIKYIILPGSTYVLTGACLWLWLLRLNDRPEPTLDDLAMGPRYMLEGARLSRIATRLAWSLNGGLFCIGVSCILYRMMTVVGAEDEEPGDRRQGLIAQTAVSYGGALESVGRSDQIRAENDV